MIIKSLQYWLCTGLLCTREQKSEPEPALVLPRFRHEFTQHRVMAGVGDKQEDGGAGSCRGVVKKRSCHQKNRNPVRGGAK